jgi:hypothetical protein
VIPRDTHAAGAWLHVSSSSRGAARARTEQLTTHGGRLQQPCAEPPLRVRPPAPQATEESASRAVRGFIETLVTTPPVPLVRPRSNCHAAALPVSDETTSWVRSQKSLRFELAAKARESGEDGHTLRVSLSLSHLAHGSPLPGNVSVPAAAAAAARSVPATRP